MNYLKINEDFKNVFRIQQKHGLKFILDERPVKSLSESFWAEFEAVEFSESEDQPNNTNEEIDPVIAPCEQENEVRTPERTEIVSDQDTIEDLNDDERADGEHVGFDGESERSEDEEMTAEDRMFLADEETEESNKNMSHLALLNLKRYDDDDIALNR